jgi:hypothetical protein
MKTPRTPKEAEVFLKRTLFPHDVIRELERENGELRGMLERFDPGPEQMSDGLLRNTPGRGKIFLLTHREIAAIRALLSCHSAPTETAIENRGHTE